jgi:peptidoglycan-associated lipoprotein
MVSWSRTLSVSLAFAALLAACGPKYPKCNKDEQCADHGEVCVDGTCQKCRDDKQCSATEQCKGGRCEPKPECSIDGDCKDNKVCKSGKCLAECQEDNDCGSGKTCAQGRCKDKLAQVDNASRDMCASLQTVYFEFNKFDLSGDAKQALSDAATCLKDKGGKIRIEGHCDERGTEEFNLVLGENRARAVQKYLTNLGVAASKLSILSKGKLEPADPGHDEAAWAKNRRAVFNQQ